jgi:hypothetical protein
MIRSEFGTAWNDFPPLLSIITEKMFLARRFMHTQENAVDLAHTFALWIGSNYRL